MLFGVASEECDTPQLIVNSDGSKSIRIDLVGPNSGLFEATFAVPLESCSHSKDFARKRFVEHIEPAKMAIAEALFERAWRSLTWQRLKPNQGGPCE